MSAWLWDRRCFLIVIVSFSRLWGFSKEGGGYPRRSCVGVAARRGDPGQEGRNQGRRANERVSGETLVSLSSLFALSVFSSLLFSVSCSYCQNFFLFLSVCGTLCVCVSLSVSAFVSLGVCFGGDTGSRGSDNSLLAPSVCVLVIVCDCTAASLGVLQGFGSRVLQANLVNNYLKDIWGKSIHRFALCHPLNSMLHSVISEQKRIAHLAGVFHQLEVAAPEFRWTANQSAVEWMALTETLWELE